MNIADDFGLPYAVVLLHADYLRRREWTPHHEQAEAVMRRLTKNWHPERYAEYRESHQDAIHKATGRFTWPG
ncbi:MAG: hypothetical protein KKA05_10385 [Alphaproteobacteria bacterium]|nr:hypothetical protein [Alphaproteobacteria bacterium]